MSRFLWRRWTRAGRLASVAVLACVPLLLGACIGLAHGAYLAEPGELPSMRTARRAVGAAIHQGHLYAAGGWNGESTQLAVVEVYDPAARRWGSGPALSVARSQHGMVDSGGRLWVVGGWNARDGLVSEVEVLDDGQGGWRTATHLPTPRREPGVAAYKGEIVVAGGFDGRSDAEEDGYSARVEAYDPASKRWRQLASLQQPRRGLSLVAAGDSLYAIGGYGPDAPGFLATVERYDAAADRWELLSWPIAARTWAAAVAVPGAGEPEIVIAGGYNRDGFLDLVERVDPRSGTVCYPPRLREGRAWFGAAAAADGVLLAGGETKKGFSAALVRATTACGQSR